MSAYLIPKLYAPLNQVVLQDDNLSINDRFLHFIVHGSFIVSIKSSQAIGAKIQETENRLK